MQETLDRWNYFARFVLDFLLSARIFEGQLTNLEIRLETKIYYKQVSEEFFLLVQLVSKTILT